MATPKSVCAWCHPDYAEEHPEEDVTHGICKSCQERLEHEAKDFWKKRGRNRLSKKRKAWNMEANRRQKGGRISD